MGDYFEKSKELIISKMREAKTLDALVIQCAIGVMGAFPYKEEGLKFMEYIYDKYLPPEVVDELKAKAMTEADKEE